MLIFSSRAISLCEYFYCPSVVCEVWIIACVGLARYNLFFRASAQISDIFFWPVLGFYFYTEAKKERIINRQCYKKSVLSLYPRIIPALSDNYMFLLVNEKTQVSFIPNLLQCVPYGT
jgi:hypothetical protein